MAVTEAPTEEHVTEVSTGEHLSGQVKWFNNQKGYGFIVRGDSEDIFVHFSAIQMEGFRTLRQGDEVQFELLTGPKGLQAINVRPAEPHAAEPEEDV